VVIVCPGGQVTPAPGATECRYVRLADGEAYQTLRIRNEGGTEHDLRDN